MSGAFDVIVFWKLDRFCRSLVDLVNIERQLREWGVALHSVTEQIDTTTPVGRFNFRNLASAAELERDLIRERARMGMHALARQKRWPNKLPPLGYDLDGEGRLKVNRKEAELVRRIFELYLKHKSMPHVAYLLNKEGLKTKRGKNWSAVAVKKVLDNEIYIGRYRVAGIDEKVEEYAIIDESTFSKVAEIRRKYRARWKNMPEIRRRATIDRIFNEYLMYARGLGEQPRII
jgi:site-specific DNA recombinase